MFSFAVKGGLRGYVSSRETLVAGVLQTYVPSVRIRRIPTFDALSTPSQAFCRLRCFRCRTDRANLERVMGLDAAGFRSGAGRCEDASTRVVMDQLASVI